METASRPAITLDLKKRRIRIHNTTLHALNDPPYIELLVNPDKLTLAVRASKQKYWLAHKMYYDTRDNELYSDTLLKQLCRVCSEMEYRGSYRINGIHYPDQSLVIFEMQKMILINETLTKEVTNECNQ